MKNFKNLFLLFLTTALLSISSTALAISNEDISNEEAIFVQPVSDETTAKTETKDITLPYFSNFDILDSTNSQKQSRVVTACAYANGICNAKSRGPGWVYNAYNRNQLLFSGAVYQCTRCYTIYFTQGEHTSRSLIQWTSWNPGEPASLYGTNLWTDPSWIVKTNSNKIPGVSLSYN